MKIWWKGINNDVKEYRKKCSICVKSGAPPKKSGELQSIVPPKKASSFWGMDHQNFGIVTTEGRTYVMLQN